jgi:acetate kinase
MSASSTAGPTLKSKPERFVLTVNSGSSSIKFALFRIGPSLARVLTGKFERVGLAEGLARTRRSCARA